MKLPVYRTPETLPCKPCPHHSQCCTHGTTLTTPEARDLAETYGPGTVTRIRRREIRRRGWIDINSENLWATTVDPTTQRCSLYRESYGCIAHDHPSYPVACRDYPWKDPHNPSLPQASDAHLCPETQRYLPYCEKCGRFPVLHSKATLCSGCCLATTTLGKLAKQGK